MADRPSAGPDRGTRRDSGHWSTTLVYRLVPPRLVDRYWSPRTSGRCPRTPAATGLAALPVPDRSKLVDCSPKLKPKRQRHLTAAPSPRSPARLNPESIASRLALWGPNPRNTHSTPRHKHSATTTTGVPSPL